MFVGVPAGLLVLCCAVLPAQQGVRQVDFRDFTYPLSGPSLGHSGLVWLQECHGTACRSQHIHLKHGSELSQVSSMVMDGRVYRQYAGFTLKSVTYGDVTGDGQEEAIVVLTYLTGGTQTTNYVYLYAATEKGPKLLAYCHTGVRSDSGLFDVYAKDGLLVFELLDPARASGDCCSSGVLISRYRWDDGAFVLAGPIRRRTLAPPKEQPSR